MHKTDDKYSTITNFKDAPNNIFSARGPPPRSLMVRSVEKIENKQTNKHKNVKLLYDCISLVYWGGLHFLCIPSCIQIHGFLLLCTPSFTKLAVSQLIMVRFEKFNIWHAQGSGADLSDVAPNATREMTSRRRTMGNHPCNMCNSDVRNHLISNSDCCGHVTHRNGPKIAIFLMGCLEVSYLCPRPLNPLVAMVTNGLRY